VSCSRKCYIKIHICVMSMEMFVACPFSSCNVSPSTTTIKPHTYQRPRP
jgi:hypothetical protein